MPLRGQVGEEALDLGRAQVLRVPPAARGLVEADELLDPEQVSPFGGVGVVLEAERLADLLQDAYRLFPPAGLAQGRRAREGVRVLARQGVRVAEVSAAAAG
jgi:hypothetical protein